MHARVACINQSALQANMHGPFWRSSNLDRIVATHTVGPAARIYICSLRATERTCLARSMQCNSHSLAKGVVRVAGTHTIRGLGLEQSSIF